MNVLLDTNIFYNNYHLNTPRFVALFEYLKKANSKLYIPEIVLKEIRKHYSLKLQSYINDVDSDERILFNKKPRILDFNELIKQYDTELLGYIKKHNIQIYKTKEINSDLDTLVERAVAEYPPFGKSGKGFQDTVVWLTIKDLIKNGKGPMCFITNNTRDFGEGVLAQKLCVELGSSMDKLRYFNSLDSFLSEYGDKLKFISEKFLSDFIANQTGALLDFVNMQDIPTSVITSAESDSSDIINVEGFWISDYIIKDFYIYGATASRYKLSLILFLNLGLDLEVFEGYSSVLPELPPTDSGIGIVGCVMELSLMIDKRTQRVSLDSSIPPKVEYSQATGDLSSL